jgi:hypothetical protein
VLHFGPTTVLIRHSAGQSVRGNRNTAPKSVTLPVRLLGESIVFHQRMGMIPRFRWTEQHGHFIARKVQPVTGGSASRFDANPALNSVRSNDDPQMLELFLLYFCDIGAQMTQPVEGWIRRAASRCAELGFEELAKALNQHAQAEHGHHLMIADVHSLVKHWNSRHSRSINADDLLNQVLSNEARSYCEVHERPHAFQ